MNANDNGAVGLDCYNQQTTGEVSKSITSAASDSDHVPCVIEKVTNFTPYGTRLGAHEDGIASTLTAMDYKFMQCVAYDRPMVGCFQNTGAGWWNQSDCAQTLRANPSSMEPPNCVAVGFDSYNLCMTGSKGRTIATNSGGLNEHIPVVLEKKYESIGKTAGGNDIAITLYASYGTKWNAGAYNGDNFVIEQKHTILENHPADSRVKVDESGTIQTLTSRMGTGGGNVPMVIEQTAYGFLPQSSAKTRSEGSQHEQSPTLLAGALLGVSYAIQASGDRSDPGISVSEEKAYCIPANPMSDRGQSVAYLTAAGFNGGVNTGDPCFKVERAPSLRARMSGVEPTIIAETVAIEGNGSRPSHLGDGWKQTDTMYTLNTTEVHGVAYSLEPGIMAREGDHYYKDVSGTLRANAGDNKMSVAYGLDSYNQTIDPVAQPLRAACGGDTAPKVMYVIDSIGGQAESVSDQDLCGCLKATHYKFPPCVSYKEDECHE